MGLSNYSIIDQILILQELAMRHQSSKILARWMFLFEESCKISQENRSKNNNESFVL